MSNTGYVNIIPGAQSAPVDATSGGSAADAYQRAVQARPTGFADNPIGAMAHAMDRMGRVATNVFGSREPGSTSGGGATDRMAAAEARVMQANEAAKAAPSSVEARQNQLRAGLELMKEMNDAGVSANDPRRVKLAGFIVGLANSLGPGNLPTGMKGFDIMGLLRLAAMITTRFGDGQGMAAAFTLEQSLRSLMGGSSVDAMQLRDQLIERFNLSRTAAGCLTGNWKVRVAGPGEAPTTNIDTRELVLDASRGDANLGVLAKAFWVDARLTNPADKDGFMKAFLKIAQQSHVPLLQRRYKEARRMARLQLQEASVGTVGLPTVSTGQSEDDESGDMFAALASWSRSPDGGHVPESVQPALGRFFA